MLCSAGGIAISKEGLEKRKKLRGRRPTHCCIGNCTGLPPDSNAKKPVLAHRLFPIFAERPRFELGDQDTRSQLSRLLHYHSATSPRRASEECGGKFSQSHCLNKQKSVTYRVYSRNISQPTHPTMKKVLILSVFAFFALAASAQSTTADKGGQPSVEQSNGGKGSKAATASTRNSSLGAIAPAPATEPTAEGKQKEGACQGESKSEKGACCSEKGKSEGGACCSEKGKGQDGAHSEKSSCAGSEKERAQAGEGKSQGSCCAGKSEGASCAGKASSTGDRKE